jgi:hypothetical protein
VDLLALSGRLVVPMPGCCPTSVLGVE